ncbi:MAG TPA: Hsp20/alpha crystallin family protein [Dehalococcoidia bacterium]|nr:Hsp20/alpha crystallin family protein [Dehalococcoidia bacterium]
MSNLIQLEPFADLRATMDRLFEEGFSRPWRLLFAAEEQTAFPVRMWETDEAVEIEAALPGIDPNAVDISVAGNVLTIKAEHPAPQDEAQRTYYRREIAYGPCMRSFSLPAEVDADKAQATYEYGILHVTLPKAEWVRPKRIKVIAGPQKEPVAALA